MIPKVIHYCWFGRGEKSRLMKKCIRSWKKYCPDYEIIEWNEDNFDVNGIKFIKGAYDAKKWAFVTDYARLDIIYKHGGIYLDTDVELLKPLDDLLGYKGFFGFEGKNIATGLGFGAEKGNLLVKQMRDDYNNDVYSKDNEICPVKNTRVLVNNGLVADGTKQEIDGVVFLPNDYLCPLENATGVLKKTENTVAIHWFDKSWVDKGLRLRSKITRVFHRFFGEDCFEKLKRGR